MSFLRNSNNLPTVKPWNCCNATCSGVVRTLQISPRHWSFAGNHRLCIMRKSPASKWWSPVMGIIKRPFSQRDVVWSRSTWNMC
jgi:hypothetical protein